MDKNKKSVLIESTPTTPSKCNTSYLVEKKIDNGFKIERKTLKDNFRRKVLRITNRSSRRRVKRTSLYLDAALFDILSDYAKKLKTSVSQLVSTMLLEKLSQIDIADYKQQIASIQRREEIRHLKEKEKELRDLQKLLGRSGAYLWQYGRQLFEGEPKPQGRIPIKYCASPEEQEAHLRILAMRESIAKRLAQLTLEELPPQDIFKWEYGEDGDLHLMKKEITK